MDLSTMVELAYLASAVLFVVGLKRMQSPATARPGNALAATAMLIAIIATLIDNQVLDWTGILIGIVIGGVIGGIAARTVKMTSMPEMVGIFNAFGGGASALVAAAEFVRLQDAGANGLVLFNRFLQPDIDLEALQVHPNVELSTSFESRLPLRWIALSRDELGVSLAATSGVQGGPDAVKLLLAGADAVMMTSALLRRGPDYTASILHGMRTWLEENEYDSVEQMKGSMSRAKSGDPGAYERANYVKTLISYTGPWV